jgi:hypothetical protein
MRNWKTMNDIDVREYFVDFGIKLRNGTVEFATELPPYDRTFVYALGLAHGVKEAILCGYEQLAAVEFGVFFGIGLRHLCRAAQFFRDDLGISINVYGFDSAAGLPALTGGYKDHPELFHEGAFVLPDQDALRATLPDFCELIIGDVAHTVSGFRAKLADRQLAFAAYDLDLYSSTKSALELLKFDAGCYLPAVPLYFDDMEDALPLSDWAGEKLAIREFNKENQIRKIDRKSRQVFHIPHFHVCQIFDHPMRQGGDVRPRFPLGLAAF